MNKIIDNFNKYIAYIKNIKNYSENTIFSYRNDFNNFVKFLSEKNEVQLENINEKTIEKFILFLGENNFSKISIARHLSTLRSFYNYLLENSVISNNPLQNIQNPKVSKLVPKILDKTSLNDKLNDLEKSPIDLMDLLILELLYSCALRVQELCNIKISELNLSKNLITIHGKGNKERMIPIGKSAMELLNNYLLSKSIKTEYLFSNKKGGKLYPKYVSRLIKKYLSNISEDGKIHPHLMRHSFASHLLDSGADLISIKELLGHENLSTTQIYTHVSIEHLKKTYQQAHPKS